MSRVFSKMSGYPGSGKSTLARLVAQKTGAIVIDHDIVKTALLESLDADMDAKAVGKISYQIEWSLIDFHLSQRFSVILDSPCLYTELIEKGTFLASKHLAKYKYVECYLDDIDEINARLRKRQRMISQIQQAAPEEAFRRIITNSKRPSNDKYLVVDASKPVESYINEVIEYVQD